jgi:Protein  of unknown function (DUF3018)
MNSKARVAAHRARLRAAGLRPIEVWAQPRHHQPIRDFAAALERDDVQERSALALRPDAQAGEDAETDAAG